MVDIDHSIFSNPNLGKETNTPFLDEVAAQADENFHAARENRLPRRVAKIERYGEYAGLVTNGPITWAEDPPEFHEENLDDYFTQREFERVEHQMGRDIITTEDGEEVRPPLDIPLAAVPVGEFGSPEVSLNEEKKEDINE